MAKVPFLPNRKVSFAADRVVPYQVKILEFESENVMWKRLPISKCKEQPSTSVKEYFIPTEITMKIKKRSQKIKFEQADEESELPVRAISTPEHNVGELTFGLGDDMSAIESTPTRKRSERQLRQPYVPPIEEALSAK
ncbi:unnamed protein product [Brugia pahangi]|uniref:Major sperm protein n=1 Tax=Brugia pahangi TaxID=6280 RepID=A0A0N4TZZ4_BRUPA|nr:unnamed protein product [Brugia pahangi]